MLLRHRRQDSSRHVFRRERSIMTAVAHWMILEVAPKSSKMFGVESGTPVAPSSSSAYYDTRDVSVACRSNRDD